MVKKLKLNLIRNKFKEEGILIFKPLDLQRYFKASTNTASLFLSRNVKNGNLVKYRRGLYGFKGEHSSEILLANKVYQPSYVSLEYAMMHYGIIPETVYSITSVTTRTSREFIINNIVYSYHRIKKKAFTGYLNNDFDGQVAFLAEPEKALVDYLYFVDLGRKGLNDRLDLNAIKKEKLIAYAKLFKRKSLLLLIEKVYANKRKHREIIY